MSVIADTIVEWDKLGDVVVNAFAAGVGVAAIFGVAIYGATRSFDASRDGRSLQATGFAVLGALAFAVVLAAVVFGIVVMTTK